MKKEDEMIDALLKEHARKGASADEEFIDSVEKRLDEEESGRSATSNRRGINLWNWGVGIAAAVTMGVVGYNGWQKDRQDTLALSDEYVPAEQIEVSKLDLEEDSMPAVAAQKIKRGKEIQRGVVVERANLEGRLGTLSSEAIPVDELSEEGSEQIGDSVSNGSRSSRVKSRATVTAAPGASLSGEIPSNASLLKAQDAPRPTFKSERYKESKDSDAFGDAFSVQPQMDLAKSKERVSGNRHGLLTDNSYKSPWKAPLSTFSVDVDTASYTNIRRMIQNGQSVPAAAVRIEEMINYFNYAYPQPDGKHPFSVNVESASCPWNPEHRLVKIGLQGKDIIREKRPAANLVFLLDVSGSMNSQDKLPLLVESMKILLKELNADDSVSIVVYAGAQGLALPPTHVDEDGRMTILKTLEDLQSGGSTNGGSGITLAYKVAKKQFVKGGVNRVILGTDGDFNVGVTDNASLISMVEREAKSGVFLSVLGFGQGNLNDSMLEAITNKGNGNYSYIDNLSEGRKVFLDDMMGTMVTIAKDVKIQVEFNPSKVKEYRLIGYANRMLRAEDFKNKRIDAGEIGAGHTVTALYEIVPGVAGEQPVLDDLKYQKNKKQPKPLKREIVDSPELMTVKLAYKQPEATKETESTYFNTPVIDSENSWPQASEDFKFASSVGLFGMLQRQSKFSGEGDYALVRKLAEAGRGSDAKGHRTEFSDLVRKVSE